MKPNPFPTSNILKSTTILSSIAKFQTQRRRRTKNVLNKKTYVVIHNHPDSMSNSSLNKHKPLMDHFTNVYTTSKLFKITNYESTRISVQIRILTQIVSILLLSYPKQQIDEVQEERMHSTIRAIL